MSLLCLSAVRRKRTSKNNSNNSNNIYLVFISGLMSIDIAKQYYTHADVVTNNGRPRISLLHLFHS